MKGGIIFKIIKEREKYFLNPVFGLGKMEVGELNFCITQYKIG